MPNPANPPPGAGHRYLPQQRSQAWLRPSCSCTSDPQPQGPRSEEHTSELQSRLHLVCRLLLEKKKIAYRPHQTLAANSSNSGVTVHTSITPPLQSSPSSTVQRSSTPLSRELPRPARSRVALSN